jgi:hypothetical protein
VNDILEIYKGVKAYVVACGFAWEIDIVENRHLTDDVDEVTFLREFAYVVLNSGMKNNVIEGLWMAFLETWHGFKDWREIDVSRAIVSSSQIFNHRKKLAGIANAVLFLRSPCEPGGTWPVLRTRLRAVGPDVLRNNFDFMGPATSRHFARNLGIDCVKPDRHLVAVARAAGFYTPDAFAAHLAALSGDRVGTVDVVVWRHASIVGRKDAVALWGNVIDPKPIG